jgi:2-phospho-L-lactate/phosphoenolpyruvate guanylyltransferase
MSLTMLGRLTRRPLQQRGACALIAIKQRVRCKTRLAETLAPAARLQLVRSMLAAVLSAADAAPAVRQIVVVSPERDTVPSNVPVIVDTGEDLNVALTEAHRMLLEFGYREALILPADLPTITAADIDGLIHAGGIGGFAIAPDTAGSGTNALCLASAQPFRFQFGPDSRHLHLQEAERIGLSPQVVHLPGLQFDVDSPADLGRLDGQPWLARRTA